MSAARADQCRPAGPSTAAAAMVARDTAGHAEHRPRTVGRGVPPPGRAHRQGWWRWTALRPRPRGVRPSSGGCPACRRPPALGRPGGAAVHRRPGDGGLGVARHLAHHLRITLDDLHPPGAVDGGRDRRAARLRPHRLPEVAQARRAAGGGHPGPARRRAGARPRRDRGRFVAVDRVRPAPAPAVGADEAGAGGVRRRHRWSGAPTATHRPSRSSPRSSAPSSSRPR